MLIVILDFPALNRRINLGHPYHKIPTMLTPDLKVATAWRYLLKPPEKHFHEFHKIINIIHPARLRNKAVDNAFRTGRVTVHHVRLSHKLCCLRFAPLAQIMHRHHGAPLTVPPYLPGLDWKPLPRISISPSIHRLCSTPLNIPCLRTSAQSPPPASTLTLPLPSSPGDGQSR